MKYSSLSETKNRLSALIDEVREGATILVLDRGLPVARIEPVVGGTPGAPGRLERLERKGLMRRALEPEGSAMPLRRPIKAKGGASALAALLAEREDGR